MTFPRNRKVGSFGDIDFGHTRFSNPTSNPRLLPENHENRERPFPDSVLKTRAEWIRARKFARNPWARGLGNADIIAVMAGLAAFAKATDGPTLQSPAKPLGRRSPPSEEGGWRSRVPAMTSLKQRAQFRG